MCTLCNKMRKAIFFVIAWMKTWTFWSFSQIYLHLLKESHIRSNCLFVFKKLFEPFPDSSKPNITRIVIYHFQKLSMMKPYFDLGQDVKHLRSKANYFCKRRRLHISEERVRIQRKCTFFIHSSLMDKYVAFIYLIC